MNHVYTSELIGQLAKLFVQLIWHLFEIKIADVENVQSDMFLAVLDYTINEQPTNNHNQIKARNKNRKKITKKNKIIPVLGNLKGLGLSKRVLAAQ